MKSKLIKAVAVVIHQINTDENQTISKSEFSHILNNKVALKLLNDAGVDVISLVSYADVIFEDETKELEFKDFMDVVFGFREEDASLKRQLELKRYLKEKIDGLLA